MINGPETGAMSEPRPLLVALRPLWLGDLLTGLPALRALRAAFPWHRLVLATRPVLAPLARLSGAVDDVLSTEPLAALPLSLQRPDIAVDLHGKGPESQRILLAASPRRLIAFAHPAVPDTTGMPEWDDEEHEVHRWCRLLAESAVPADPGRLELDTSSLAVPLHACGATLIHPGAKSRARCWPPERFAAVARAEAAAGRRVVLTGTRNERPLAEWVAALAGLPSQAVQAGETDLLELAARVAAARVVVSNDTGTAHLATAVGTPSVVLFGPTPPAQWGPPESDPRHVALWTGRRGDPHAETPDPGLLEIGVDEVMAAVRALTDA